MTVKEFKQTIEGKNLVVDIVHVLNIDVFANYSIITCDNGKSISIDVVDLTIRPNKNLLIASIDGNVIYYCKHKKDRLIETAFIKEDSRLVFKNPIFSRLVFMTEDNLNKIRISRLKHNIFYLFDYYKSNLDRAFIEEYRPIIRSYYTKANRLRHLI